MASPHPGLSVERKMVGLRIGFSDPLVPVPLAEAQAGRAEKTPEQTPSALPN
jgi:hypothetical protein